MDRRDDRAADRRFVATVAADLLKRSDVPGALATRVLAGVPDSAVTRAFKLWGDDENPFKRLIASQSDEATILRVIGAKYPEQREVVFPKGVWLELVGKPGWKTIRRDDNTKRCAIMWVGKCNDYGKKLNSALAEIARWKAKHPRGKAMSGLSIPASYYFGAKPSRRLKAVRQKARSRAAAN
jgi:hypothetical protein